MQPDILKSSAAYHESLHESLENTFLRKTLDKFAVDYRANRTNIFLDVPERELIAQIAEDRDRSCKRLDELYQQFKKEAEKRGAKVHFAETADDANEIIAQIAQDNKVKSIIKSKSMTAEETLLNQRLEKDGLEVTETDLGEWIIQLRGEPPSHMVMPAIHLSRDEVAEDFSRATQERLSNDIGKLVKVSRRELRPKFIQADMGISGANFAIAENGSIALVTNEGNDRLVTTLPRVHVALIGIEKLTPTLEEALTALQMLPRNATSQRLTSYVSWIGGGGAACKNAYGQRQVHFVFLDNGRVKIAKDPLFSQVLRCVRCGACANVCPVYRLVGGHKMGNIYIGAIGIILSYFFFDKDKARILAQNCVGCEACSDVCAGGIELPRLIREIRACANDEEGSPRVESLISSVMKNRSLFHTLLKFAKFGQRPVTGGTPFMRHLPHIFAPKHGFIALPALARHSFRERWGKICPSVPDPQKHVAIFAGCAQDFIYPEQLEAAVKLLAAHNIAVDFPDAQTCCGLPLEALGQRALKVEVARQNAKAFDSLYYDAIITLCASCASHIKHAYPKLIESGEDAFRTQAFSQKITDFASYVHDELKLGAESFIASGEKVCYHASCHLCRALGVRTAPRALIQSCAEYVPAAEEELCCGCGGSYMLKFPEVSSQLLDKKLEMSAATGASRLVVDCPGCIMQLRGGAEQKGMKLKVSHLAELLAENMKP
ncbi:MAG: LUD domain-containing protein [Actinomycetia bacterium]|nr:LUD domain-containing protein [Actinomycetes bacterium]